MRKVLSIIVAAVLLLGVMPVVSFATEIVDSGTCGENLTWTLDDEGTLTISGEGEMNDYKSWNDFSSNRSPWNFNYSILSVVIENGVTSIGSYAYQDCRNLKNVILKNGVTRIGYGAFESCLSLETIIIPDSVTDISGSIFGSDLLVYCNKGSYAQTYAENNNLAYCLLDGTEEENTISGSIGRMDWSISRSRRTLYINCLGAMPSFSLGTAPWYNYPKAYLHYAEIENGTTNIGAYAFTNQNWSTEDKTDDYSFKRIIIPDSVKSIGAYAFCCQGRLSGLVLPNDLESIGTNAFKNCKALDELFIPNNVTSIGDESFYGCSGLSSVTIPESVTSIGNSAFIYCRNLKRLTILGNGTWIGGSVFQCCSSLTDLTIAEGIKKINSSDFALCTSLTSVELPVSVTSVKAGAFKNCSALESIYFYNPNCTIEAGATPANATVYGYSGSTAETYADENGLRFMEIDGHEHHFTVTKTVEPTCTEDGYKNLSCPCGERKTETIPATGHTEVIVPAKAATCTEGGYEAWSYCEVCGEPLTEKVETQPNGHTPLTTGAYAATCSKNGFTGVTYCSVCKEVLNAGETILATGAHTPGEAVETVLKASSCGEDGMKLITVKCSVCGETLSTVNEIIPATDAHTAGEAEETILAEATCGKDGLKLVTVKCSDCGKTLSESTESIPASGDHTPGEPVKTVLEEATCGQKGIELVTVKCAVCGETLSTTAGTIPATGAHTPGAATQTVLTEATCTAAGKKVITVQCIGCGETLSETAEDIPARGHADADGNGQCDRCNASLKAETPPQPEQPQQSGSSEKHWYDRIVNFFKSLFNLFKF